MNKKEIAFCPFCAGRLEQKAVHGRVRLVCTQCREIYYQNPVPAATALVLNGQNHLLLGRRSVEPAYGEWCLPGGFIEIGETMEQAALRELKEETGLDGRSISFVGCFAQTSRQYGAVIVFGYHVEVLGGVLNPGDDISELLYFDLDRMPPVAFDSHRRLIDILRAQLQPRGSTP
jgi:ADP-ribose pyrophosphatase YjhB (NUDIX family)